MSNSRNICHDKSERVMSRNSWVELLRILAMLMIVTSHFTVSVDWELFHPSGIELQALAKTITNWCGLGGASLFFIITGYFMVGKSFNYKRLVKLWLQVLSFTVPIFIIYSIVKILIDGDVSYSRIGGMWIAIFKSFFPLLNNAYWFMTIYALLLLLSPFINSIVRNVSRKAFLGFVVIIAFLSIWPYISLFDGVWNDLGFAVLSYCIGVLIHEFKSLWRQKKTKLICGTYIPLSFCIMWLFTYLGSGPLVHVATIMGWNTKFWIAGGRIVVFPVLASGAMMALAVGAGSMKSYGFAKTIDFLATGAVGVYLIHTNILLSAPLWYIFNSIANFSVFSLTIQWIVLIPCVLILFSVYLIISCIYEHLISRPFISSIMRLL